jgi:multiple sugar transport system substrate-binding protein
MKQIALIDNEPSRAINTTFKGVSMKGNKVFLVMLLSLFIVGGGVLFAGGQQGAAKGKPVDLSFWTSSQSMLDFYEIVVGDYMKANANVNIETSFTPIADYITKLSVTLPSGTAGDVLEMEDSWAFRYVEKYLQPNPQDIDRMVRDTCREDVLESVIWDGKTVGVPLDFFHELMFFNKTMFAEAGLSGAPEDYDQLKSYAQKLTRYDGAGSVTRSGLSLRLSGNPAGNTQKFWALGLLPYGADINEESATEPGKFHNALNNEGGRKALQLFIDLLYKYKVDDHKSMKDAEAFAQGKTAMFEREPWVADYMRKNGPDVDWGSSPVPRADQWATFFACLILYVPNEIAAEKNDAAWDFVRYLGSREIAEIMVKEHGSMSPRTDLNYDELLQATPRLVDGMEFPEGLKLYGPGRALNWVTCNVKLGEALPEIFRKKSLLDNPQGIAAEVEQLAQMVDDILREGNEYAR